jgi:NADPH2:quinone reductase
VTGLEIADCELGDAEGLPQKNLIVQKLFLQRARYKLLALHTLVERGQLEPVIDSVMPLGEVTDAHRRLEEGGVRGKIVLQVAE